MTEWKTIDSAPQDIDIQLWCKDTGQQFVGYQEGKIRGLFCYAIHRGAFIMCKPDMWQPLPSPPKPNPINTEKA